MFAINLMGPLVTLAVTAGLLAVAGPAGADVVSPKDPASGLHLSQPGNGLAPVSFSAVPEMDAGANAFFQPEVDDEVLA